MNMTNQLICVIAFVGSDIVIKITITHFNADTYKIFLTATIYQVLEEKENSVDILGTKSSKLIMSGEVKHDHKEFCILQNFFLRLRIHSRDLICLGFLLISVVNGRKW